MPNGMSERSALIEHCGVGGSVRKDTLYPIVRPAAHVCLCGESPLSARTGEGLVTRQVGGGNDLDGGSR